MALTSLRRAVLAALRSFMACWYASGGFSLAARAAAHSRHATAVTIPRISLPPPAGLKACAALLDFEGAVRHALTMRQVAADADAGKRRGLAHERDAIRADQRVLCCQRAVVIHCRC